jgi:hypothetical protein
LFAGSFAHTDSSENEVTLVTVLAYIKQNKDHLKCGNCGKWFTINQSVETKHLKEMTNKDKLTYEQHLIDGACDGSLFYDEFFNFLYTCYQKEINCHTKTKLYVNKWE